MTKNNSKELFGMSDSPYGVFDGAFLYDNVVDGSKRKKATNEDLDVEVEVEYSIPWKKSRREHESKCEVQSASEAEKQGLYNPYLLPGHAQNKSDNVVSVRPEEATGIEIYMQCANLSAIWEKHRTKPYAVLHQDALNKGHWREIARVEIIVGNSHATICKAFVLPLGTEEERTSPYRISVMNHSLLGGIKFLCFGRFEFCVNDILYANHMCVTRHLRPRGSKQSSALITVAAELTKRVKIEHFLRLDLGFMTRPERYHQMSFTLLKGVQKGCWKMVHMSEKRSMSKPHKFDDVKMNMETLYGKGVGRLLRIEFYCHFPQRRREKEFLGYVQTKVETLRTMSELGEFFVYTRNDQRSMTRLVLVRKKVISGESTFVLRLTN
eukprot:Plantae.Rhodophyta-Hildenbrandia_rubra.ctg48724.p1 GENE.Plantae.Rhodophyta-Hildenbrandia_rubra.ctg48724~~Plantae.Rhodophyta-Hildenbrandia_rubra.ctg48724.p1  ORF type:complete len:381 (-),score=59.94 Plantae.Rhodophyta-Hildenbrandia_rubra.ctg48724:53-1195(-)